MPKIDSVFFGGIIIDGKTHNSDVVIFSNGDIIDHPRTHLLDRRTIQDILLRDPELIIVGTGHSGMLKIDPAAELAMKIQGVELLERTTREAADLFNRQTGKRKVAAVIHVTC